VLNRSIPTRKALVHSIPITEVKDMKSDILQALDASLSKNFFELDFLSSILTIFKKENSIVFKLLPTTFSPLELTF
jgi:hypothetical protein